MEMPPAVWVFSVLTIVAVALAVTIAVVGAFMGIWWVCRRALLMFLNWREARPLRH